MTALTRLFSEGFRIFFLLAGLWGALAMLVWGLWLGLQGWGGMMDLPNDLVPQWWHGHEMIFGFGSAAAAGFFLTAVPNWTGAPPARPRFIVLAAVLWAAGRVSVWLWGTVPGPVAAAVTLAFLPMLAGRITQQLLARRNGADIMFLGLLSLMWLAQIRVMLDFLGLPLGDAGAGLHGGIAVLIALIVVLGGRITPAFTRNALGRAASARGVVAAPETLPVQDKTTDRVAIGAAILAAAAITLGLPAPFAGAAQIVLGLAQLWRMRRWRGLAVRREPILAVLHGAMALVGLGALLQGLAAFGLGSQIGALHFSALGGVGTMVLAVMSRATLGHTGRPLLAPAPVVLAYALIPVAALIRWAAALGPLALYTPGTLLAASLWVLAFGLFVQALGPALLGPRLRP
ncbi:NnrS family protein [Rhodobacter maris]|uniref:Uncharacterized protein involved in response to NO n=1 Tax=Rhodobacter maris TaxID=446682 RepID=A0A285TB50_9RHOB|nr:NnrS family protein [Rhodobacter maris]SOC16999.1 uncharacterized protein involved in response to NO [Rhodobacter maris]